MESRAEGILSQNQITMANADGSLFGL